MFPICSKGRKSPQRGQVLVTAIPLLVCFCLVLTLLSKELSAAVQEGQKQQETLANLWVRARLLEQVVRYNQEVHGLHKALARALHRWFLTQSQEALTTPFWHRGTAPHVLPVVTIPTHQPLSQGIVDNDSRLAESGLKIVPAIESLCGVLAQVSRYTWGWPAENEVWHWQRPTFVNCCWLVGDVSLPLESLQDSLHGVPTLLGWNEDAEHTLLEAMDAGNNAFLWHPKLVPATPCRARAPNNKKSLQALIDCGFTKESLQTTLLQSGWEVRILPSEVTNEVR